jgi:transglutaminase-like putative cysteine protease
VTAAAPTTYDRVLALQAWMRHNTRYSLDAPVPPPGTDAVDRFLFVDRVGFCEQIGSALVVMLRSLGVPARLAVGYTPGQRNPFTGLYEVRASNAHSWAEVYFPGVGWQGFDPTASVPLAGEAGHQSAGSGVLSYLAVHVPTAPPWLPDVVVVLLGLVAVAVPARHVWTRRRLRRLARERPWADRLLARMEAVGAARGRPRRPSETARQYAAALSASVVPDPRLAGVAETVELDAFSGRPVPLDDRAEAEAALEAALRH